ncbi:MAG: hypothetical protein LBT00_16470 [Spirochaetaceae bacterium]|jgi:hypothetical protein|nr:hypothetical protein [Spirochaetaceae bacterium]
MKQTSITTTAFFAFALLVAGSFSPSNAGADTDTPFGKRSDGGSSEGGSRHRPRRQPAAQPEEASKGSAEEVSPLLRELAALNARRASAIAAGMSDRNRRDISALSFLKKRAQSSANIDALKAIAAAEADIGKNRRIFPANLQNKDLQKQYDSLRDTRAKHITAAVKTAANRLKPDYEKLLKRAIALEKYADAEAIKRAIGALEGGGAQRFVGRAYRREGNKTITFRGDGKVDVPSPWSPDVWEYSEEENKLLIGTNGWFHTVKDENTLVDREGRTWRRVK